MDSKKTFIRSKIFQIEQLQKDLLQPLPLPPPPQQQQWQQQLLLLVNTFEYIFLVLGHEPLKFSGQKAFGILEGATDPLIK